MARGLENNNPGNIRQSKVRYKGEVRPSRDPAFKQFESLAWGYRAIFVLLHTYRVRHGLRSIREMISRWAPPSENRTEAYIRAVSADTGIGPDEALETLDPATMVPVAAVVFQKVCLDRSLQIPQICKYSDFWFQNNTPRRVVLIFVL